MNFHYLNFFTDEYYIIYIIWSLFNCNLIV